MTHQASKIKKSEMNQIRATRAFSISAVNLAHGGRLRRTWKPYYNNRHGYVRSKNSERLAKY